MKLEIGRSGRMEPEAGAWPTDKAGVLAVARSWMDPGLARIDEAAVAALAPGSIRPAAQEMAPRAPGRARLRGAIERALAFNSINHMFWRVAADGRFERHQRNGKVGAEAMASSFAAAWEDPGSPIAKARLGEALDEAAVAAVFGDLPDLPGRVRILNEVLLGPALGQAAGEIEAAAERGEALGVAQAARLAELFPQAYGDEVLKKAQLAVSMAWRQAGEAGLAVGCELTAFADYQIPNALRSLGIVQYGEALAARIDARELIEAGSPEERAIRAASILAVERLAAAQGARVADVDLWLWLRRNEVQTPFHLTVTTLY